MAATIAKATGRDTSRVKETRRLGSVSSYVEANTWRTFTSAFVHRDGSGYVEVTRDGKTLCRFNFGPEAKETDEALSE